MQELLVGQVLEQNRVANAQIQYRVAELFLNVDERTVIDFIQQMEDTNNANEQTRATRPQGVIHQLVQRLRLCLHPDKNREHPRAAERAARRRRDREARAHVDRQQDAHLVAEAIKRQSMGNEWAMNGQ